MLTLVPTLVPSFLKSPPRPSRGHQHLMLAGINQNIFINQWGEPETQISLKRLGSLDKLGSIFLIEDPAREARHSIWIYKKKDRILFFTKKRLISHSRWSEFREQWKKSTHSTPRSEARGMLRVDTDRRFLPRFKNRGLAPSNLSKEEPEFQTPRKSPPLFTTTLSLVA